MANLWEETIRKLADHNLNFDKDVIQVQTYEGYINKEIFKMMAMATNYNNGYGSAEIREDLVIVGNGWWLERDEYGLTALHLHYSKKMQEPRSLLPMTTMRRKRTNLLRPPGRKF